MTNSNDRPLRFDGADEKRQSFGLIQSLADQTAIAGIALVGREVVKQTGETIREKIRQGSNDQTPPGKAAGKKK